MRSPSFFAIGFFYFVSSFSLNLESTLQRQEFEKGGGKKTGYFPIECTHYFLISVGLIKLTVTTCTFYAFA